MTTKTPVLCKIQFLDSAGGVVKETIEQVGMAEHTGPMANVGVKLGTTKNLGNYESLKVDVSLHIPCQPTDKAIARTYKRCFKIVDEKLAEIMEDV